MTIFPLYEGKSVSTRRVVAYQGNDESKKMFILEGSFKKSEPSPINYQKSPPILPRPNELFDIQDLYKDAVQNYAHQLDNSMLKLLQLKSTEKKPIDEKPCHPEMILKSIVQKAKSYPLSVMCRHSLMI